MSQQFEFLSNDGLIHCCARL